MFLPSSIGVVLPNALLDPVDESLWYPVVPTGVSTSSEGDSPSGINVGVLFTVQQPGELHSLCYYRVSGTMAATGTLGLWDVSNYGNTLLASVDFTGHSGTGWQVVPLEESFLLSPSKAYIASLWTPNGGTHTVLAVSASYFSSAGRISTPNSFLYAQPSNGQEDLRGFVKRNGVYLYGAFARPTEVFNNANYWVDVIYNARPKPPPPDPPMILKWAIPDGWPSEATTGHDPETELTYVPTDISSTADGQIIENLDVFGSITVNHSNVTVRNCSAKASIHVVLISPGANNCVVEDCTLDGRGRNNAGGNGVYVAGLSALVQRNNIFRVENGMTLAGHATPANYIIRDNFIHHLRATPGSPHYDGIQADGQIDTCLFDHNTIMNEQGDTAALMIDTYAGPMTNIMVQDNYLCGAGFTCYADEFGEPPGLITNISYHRNLLQMGNFGYFNIQMSTDYPEMLGNQHMTHGGLFDAPPPGGFLALQSVPEGLFNVYNNGGGGPSGELVDISTGGLTLGVAFQMGHDGQITGLNFDRTSSPSTYTVEIALWRYTGSTIDGGVELLGSRTITNYGQRGIRYFAFDTPIDVEDGDNLLAAVFIPRGSDGKVWYAPVAGVFWPDPMPSQWERFTAFANNPAIPLNGFAGQNGLYHYGPAMTLPTTAAGFDNSFGINPVFVAPWEGEVADVTVAVSSPGISMSPGTVTVATTGGVTVPVTGSEIGVAQGGVSVATAGSVSVAVSGVSMAMTQGTPTAVGKRNVSTAVTSPAGLTLTQGSVAVTVPTRVNVSVGVTSPAITMARGTVGVTAVGATTLGDATNTGVPAGTTLTAATNITTTSIGQIIQNRNVSGTITVNHANCIIRRCKAGAISCRANNTLVEDTEVIGTGGGNGIDGWGVFRRVNVHGFENAFNLASPGTGGVYNSYLWGMAGNDATAHYDTFQIDGDVANFEIAYCTIENLKDDTSCVMIDNYWGAVNNIDVHDCVMIGGGSVTVYSDGHFNSSLITNVKYRNNLMDRGFYGYKSFANNAPVWTNNRDRLTGVLIP